MFNFYLKFFLAVLYLVKNLSDLVKSVSKKKKKNKEKEGPRQEHAG